MQNKLFNETGPQIKTKKNKQFEQLNMKIRKIISIYSQVFFFFTFLIIIQYLCAIAFQTKSTIESLISYIYQAIIIIRDCS